MSILIVDDDRDDHFFLSKALREHLPEVTVHSCFDGSELLDHLSTGHKPDLIFLDLNMPKMDGRVTTASLKSNDKYANIPLIIFTTSTSLQDRLELTDLGADDFFTKPVTAKDLNRIVENVARRWL